MSASPPEEKSEKEETAFNIIKDWFLNSPTHGIRRIRRANSISGRIFWSTTFLIFTALMCIFIYTVIMKYITYPTKISLSVRQYRDPNLIPTVTFCNLNPLRNETFLNEEKNRSLLLNPTRTDDERQDQVAEYMSEVLAKNINNSQLTMVKSGYKLTDLLIQCKFNGRSCNENFTPFFHPNYGNCYTFNNSNTNESYQQNNISNFWLVDDENDVDGYKLFLELFLYQNEYLSYLDDRAAFRLFIHPKHEIPILSENSFFLPPTTFTKLIFSQRVVTFFQQCRNDLTDDMKFVFNSNSVQYSQALCVRLCQFRFIKKHYECTDPFFLVFLRYFSTSDRAKQMKTKPLCSIGNKSRIVTTRFNSKEFCQECLPECKLVQYTIQSSYADYPNLRSQEKTVQRVEEHFKKIGYPFVQSNTSQCLNNRRDNLLNDIVAVEISASPYATEILGESPMYTWVDLISSIGGQTGLWIGVSLISFVELAELLFLLLCHFIKKTNEDILNRWKNFKQRFSKQKTSTKL